MMKPPQDAPYIWSCDVCGVEFEFDTDNFYDLYYKTSFYESGYPKLYLIGTYIRPNLDWKQPHRLDCVAQDSSANREALFCHACMMKAVDTPIYKALSKFGYHAKYIQMKDGRMK